MFADIFGRPGWTVRTRTHAASVVACIFGILLAYAITHESWTIAVAGLILLLLLRWPVEMSFGSLLFLLPFDSISIVGIKASGEGTPLTYFAGALAIIVLLASAAAQGRWQCPPRALWYWSLFIVWSATTYLYAIEPKLVSARLPTAFSLLLLFLAGVCFRISCDEFRRVTLFVIAGGAAAGLISAFEFFQGPTSGTRGTLTINDISTDPNIFALSLLLPFALAVAYLFVARRWSVRFLSLCVVSIIALGLFLTMSRGALLALATVLVVFLVRLRTKLRMTVPVLALAVILSFMPEVFFLRLHTAVESGGAGRLDIWEAGFSAIGRYGLVGAGVDNFPLAYNEYAGHSERYRGVARDAHNVFLAVWVETGGVGLMLFLAALKSQLGKFRHLRYELGRAVPVEAVAAEAACWAMLVASFFLQTLWRKAFWVVWIFAAMCVQMTFEQAKRGDCE